MSCVSQGYATVSLASYSGDTVLREWYNILSSRFMNLDSTTDAHSTTDRLQCKQVCHRVLYGTDVSNSVVAN